MDEGDKFNLLVNTSSPKEREVFTVQCTIRDTETVLTSKSFGIAVNEDCRNASHYKPINQSNQLYWMYQNTSADKANFVKYIVKDTELFWRPRGCLFQKCFLEKRGVTEPFYKLELSKDNKEEHATQYVNYEYSFPTTERVLRDSYRYGCQLNETDTVVYTNDFTAEINVDCEDTGVYR